LMMSRAFTAMVAIGSFGVVGNYGQVAYAWQDRQRFKNPLDPPTLGMFDAPAEFLMKLMDQGTVVGHDWQKLAEGLSLYRAGTRAAETVAINATDSEFGRLAQAQRDRHWARKIARRYADETGIEGKRRAPDEPTFTENTPSNRRIKDALLLGETERAKAILLERLAEIEDPTPAKLDSLVASVRSAVRSGRPALVVEAQSNAEAQEFLGWAKDNLTPEGYARLERIDKTYMRAARRSGIWKPERVDFAKRTRSERPLSEAAAQAIIARKIHR
jgi:hypothetical protein